MKHTCIAFLCLIFTSCSWEVDPTAIEQHAIHRLELHPTDLSYNILIVPDAKAVSAEHEKIYKQPTSALAFYSYQENLIVVPRQCRIEVLRHEVGHAVVAAYFKQPLPRWLKERLAAKCEPR